MSGWVTQGSGSGPASGPGTPGGPVAWETPHEAPGLGVREMLGGAWRLYRSAGRPLLFLAIVGELVQAVFTIPSIQVFVAEVQGVIRVFGDFAQYRSDPEGLQAAFQAAVRPPGDLLVIAAAAGGIGLGIWIIVYATLTTAALNAAESRVGIASAFRAVAKRTSTIVIPAIVVAVVWAAVTAASASVQPTAPVATRPNALNGLLGLLVLVLSVGAFVLAVVCSLALPAILAENLGLRRGLARGAELTRGVRFRLGLAFVVIVVLQGLTVGFSAAVIALIGGLAARSLEVGVVVYFAAIVIGGLVWLPFVPSMLTVVYRDRVKREGEARSAAVETSIDDGGPAPEVT